MDKYKVLTIDLEKALTAGLKVSTNDDGGTCNLDGTFLTLKGWREERVLASIKAAGIHCIGKIQWVGKGYLINTGGGQGDNRTRIRNKFLSVLKEKGYDVLSYDQID